ncbi:MAG: prepilin-type N-terminal cleavage/methylation domain-containing protein [Sideroxydans sp.]|nr:prepilin-type N-terminal cleavage/methylation domain-containing protein [Sideroxydans sp.]
MKRNQSGFTLIEIAIVLVIIGLLLGGVLKGQELINSAKVKNLATDFKNIPVYVYGYQDKYRSMPGDDATPASHVTGGTKCTPDSTSHCVAANGIIDGNWNASGVADESSLFWQHVRLAGFAAGTTDTATTLQPTNAVGGLIGVTNAQLSPASGITGSFVICSNGILGKFAKQLDITMDDGNTATGTLRVAAANTATNNNSATDNEITNTEINDDTPYLVCQGN